MPWILCRKTLERPDFIRFWIDRALTYPYPITLEGLSRQAQAIAGHDTVSRLGEIRVPTLITTGTEDILVPPSSSRDLHARILGSSLHAIEDAGHLHFIEQAEKFNAICLEFLTKHRGR
jgi:pimeloyl-ACP methyl ester carboxylesterase